MYFIDYFVNNHLFVWKIFSSFFYNNILQRTLVHIEIYARNSLHYLNAFYNLTKHGVVSVEMERTAILLVATALLLGVGKFLTHHSRIGHSAEHVNHVVELALLFYILFAFGMQFVYLFGVGFLKALVHEAAQCLVILSLVRSEVAVLDLCTCDYIELATRR